MRKLLQNKLVVSVLAAVAVLSIAANFVRLPNMRSLTAVAREAPFTAEPPPIGIKYHTHGPAFTRLSSQPWRELFPIDPKARDPFAPPVLAAPASIPGPKREAPALPPTFILQGVSIEAGRALAVINQSIVAEGESIDGYRVDRILPHRVDLSGPFGELTLDLNRPSASKKSAIATPPNADLPAESKPTAAGSKNQ